ncbi:glycosyltransferase [Terriglobus roseus]|uniref:Glycosyltransferase involved in cell wall bisynthesis n=1 Tax=Terriglobus roseus TaxID=392734 RepID=A0A1H4SIK3_9BACT|nr:glycosyltransferase [Terriglobus roseus]SEC44012.1 Glycosyltransferase involved in cell wall bisynthesis [Terriglobus roseus]
MNEVRTAIPKTRILFVIDEMESITAGGTERQLLHLIKVCKAAGMRPYVAVLRGTKWLTADLAGCPVQHFQWASLFSISSVVRALEFLRYLQHRKFSIVHALFPESNLIVPVLSRIAGVSVVVGHRRNLRSEFRTPMAPLILLQRLSNLAVDAVVVNSEAVRKRVLALERVPSRKLHLVYNGIDLRAMQPSAQERSRFRRALGLGPHHLLVGNLSGLRLVKGIDTFIDAAIHLRIHTSLMRFVVVGEGDQKDALLERIRSAGLEDVFTICDPAMDVRAPLSGMDIGVLSSRAEGFSNSLLEYMSFGLPIVATDVGGNREALGGAGLLIPPGDPSALASAILSLRDPHLREALGCEAKRTVGKFEMRCSDSRFVDIQLRLLQRNRPADSTSPVAPTADPALEHASRP